jgi:hypothetical protein
METNLPNSNSSISFSLIESQFVSSKLQLTKMSVIFVFCQRKCGRNWNPFSILWTLLGMKKFASKHSFKKSVIIHLRWVCFQLRRYDFHKLAECTLCRKYCLTCKIKWNSMAKSIGKHCKTQFTISVTCNNQLWMQYMPKTYKVLQSVNIQITFCCLRAYWK